MSAPDKAVFLSYASQDVAAALRISTALRAAGVEVWLDQEGGLVGGDAWDRKIREQIGSCTLFVPLISANTQARHEGYFRLEWKLAEDRSHLIAKGKPFIVPVSVDGTTERGALVPDAFLAVQWTRLPGGEAPAAFVVRVQKLLGGPSSESTTATTRPLDDAQGRRISAPASGPPVSSDLAVQNIAAPTVVGRPIEGAFETVVHLRPLWRRALPFAATAIATLLVAGLVAWRLWPTAASAPVNRFSYRLPDGQAFRGTGRHVLAVSPDGRRFVFHATGGLYVRSLGELEARVIPGTEGALSEPFFSPDGQSVGYAEARELKRIALNGGSPVVIGALGGRSSAAGASWAPDGTILFADEAAILRVPATGGTPVVLIPAPNGKRLMNPRLLPDGDTVLFTEGPRIGESRGEVGIVAQKISTGERKVLVEGGVDARYLATGHLVYVVGNVLMGVAFDARRLAVTGGAVRVVQGVMMSAAVTGMKAANYGVAADGTLVWVYSAVSGDSDVWQLALSDRAGKLTALALPPGPYDTPRASPDGTRVAVGVADPKEAHIAIYDLDGKTALRPLTFRGNNRYPVWSRDGERVTFQSDREGDRAIFWQLANGTGPAERLTKPEKDTAHVPASWSPKDETLLFAVVPTSDLRSPGALWTYARASGTAAPFGNVKAAAHSPMFSPDGRWVAYAISGNSGGIYIQPFPATGAQHQLPRLETEGLGNIPFWSPDSTILFYEYTATQFGAVTVTTQPTVAFGNSTQVPRSFPAGSASLPRAYDIMPDGRLIGRIAPGQATGADGAGQMEIRIVLNWTEELKRLVPVK